MRAPADFERKGVALPRFPVFPAALSSRAPFPMGFPCARCVTGRPVGPAPVACFVEMTLLRPVLTSDDETGYYITGFATKRHNFKFHVRAS